MRSLSACLVVVACLTAPALTADPKAEAREALWAAVRAGDDKAIVALLDKGADVNAKNEYGISALWIAAQSWVPQPVGLLVPVGPAAAISASARKSEPC